MPDRELDAWLAEHLFGLVGCTFDECREAAEERKHYHYPGHGWGSWKRADRYSSTGDGMLQVLEGMRERGFEGKCGISLEQHGYQRWGSFFDGEHDGPRGEAEAATLPLAVALAAKATLEAARPIPVDGGL